MEGDNKVQMMQVYKHFQGRSLRKLYDILLPTLTVDKPCTNLEPPGMWPLEIISSVKALVLGFAPFKVQGSTPHGCKQFLGAILPGEKLVI